MKFTIDGVKALVEESLTYGDTGHALLDQSDKRGV